MYKVSVIIPVFNAESTLKRAINSVINQTLGFDDIELILVDDKSTDGSKDIIDSYAHNYSNIKPIYLEENTGSPSQPRNIGIENASAPYLMFLDNDDEYFSDYCEVMYTKIINNDVDIVNCDFSSKLNNNVYISKSIDEINFQEKFCDEIDKMFLKHTAWGNIYNAELIKTNNIRFPSTLYEDGVFSINCLLKTKKPVLRIPNYPGYVYLIENDDSITHKANLNTLANFFEGYKICGKLLDESTPHVKQELFNIFVNMAIFILVKLDDLDEGIKILSEFENALDFDITLGSKPLNFVNEKIVNGQFKQAKILLKLMGAFYNNKKIRNYIFINYSNLKLLGES